MKSENKAMEKFVELVAEIERIDAKMEESPDPQLELLLNHVLAHPEARQQFAQAFVDIALHKIKGPRDIVEFCMHELRWPEVKQALTDRLQAETSERMRHYLRGLLESFDDNWDHAHLYPRFSDQSELK